MSQTGLILILIAFLAAVVGYAMWLERSNRSVPDGRSKGRGAPGSDDGSAAAIAATASVSASTSCGGSSSSDGGGSSDSGC